MQSCQHMGSDLVRCRSRSRHGLLHDTQSRCVRDTATHSRKTPTSEKPYLRNAPSSPRLPYSCASFEQSRRSWWPSQSGCCGSSQQYEMATTG
eukprot:2096888-Prymnesium_polylepis.1